MEAKHTPDFVEEGVQRMNARFAEIEAARAEALRVERLNEAAPDMLGALIEAAQVAQEAFQAALQDVPEGSCIPPWITRLEQAAARAHAALVKADGRFKPLGASQ